MKKIFRRCCASLAVLLAVTAVCQSFPIPQPGPEPDPFVSTMAMGMGLGTTAATSGSLAGTGMAALPAMTAGTLGSIGTIGGITAGLTGIGAVGLAGLAGGAAIITLLGLDYKDLEEQGYYFPEGFDLSSWYEDEVVEEVHAYPSVPQPGGYQAGGYPHGQSYAAPAPVYARPSGDSSEEQSGEFRGDSGDITKQKHAYAAPAYGHLVKAKHPPAYGPPPVKVVTAVVPEYEESIKDKKLSFLDYIRDELDFLHLFKKEKKEELLSSLQPADGGYGGYGSHESYYRGTHKYAVPRPIIHKGKKAPVVYAHEVPVQPHYHAPLPHDHYPSGAVHHKAPVYHQPPVYQKPSRPKPAVYKKPPSYSELYESSDESKDFKTIFIPSRSEEELDELKSEGFTAGLYITATKYADESDERGKFNSDESDRGIEIYRVREDGGQPVLVAKKPLSGGDDDDDDSDEDYYQRVPRKVVLLQKMPEVKKRKKSAEKKKSSEEEQ